MSRWRSRKRSRIRRAAGDGHRIELPAVTSQPQVRGAHHLPGTRIQVVDERDMTSTSAALAHDDGLSLVLARAMQRETLLRSQYTASVTLLAVVKYPHAIS